MADSFGAGEEEVMRRFLITISASALVVAFVPASAVARKHHRHHHRGAVHRVHRERFGRFSDPSSPSTMGSGVGTVDSFDNSSGILKITLNDGSTVSGRVTRDTELECQSAEDSSFESDDHGRTSGDDNGEEAGNEENGEEAGENDPGDDGRASCSTGSLKSGAEVFAAELRISPEGSEWHKVELGS